jgi:hypothetical protein
MKWTAGSHTGFRFKGGWVPHAHLYEGSGSDQLNELAKGAAAC